MGAGVKLICVENASVYQLMVHVKHAQRIPEHRMMVENVDQMCAVTELR